MADNVSISYSFQTGPITTGTQTDTPVADQLIAFTNCERVELGNNSVLLLNRNNGKQMTISPEVATALTYCTSFKTLQEHAQTLVSSIPQLKGQLADVAKVLNMVNDAGLMLSAQTVCDRLKPATIPTAELAPTRVCVITCDRPPAVERLLDSMLQAGSLSRHEQLFLVDDSRNPGNREQNRELVAKFNLTSPKDMLYVGAGEQHKLLLQLIDALPEDEDAIRFLIDRERWAPHKSYGLARTLCLLLSVGRRCLMLDDDVLCRSVQPPVTREGMSFGGGSNRELTCYPSEQDLLQHTNYSATDPLSGHASCLGMTLGQAIAHLDASSFEQSTLYDTSATMLNTLHADSPILVTQCGSWGDPGTVGTNWYYHLGQESIDRVLAGPGGLSAAMENRHYWLGRTRPNISKMAVMSQATGLDNSQLLPPYFPILRSEDYLFASMVVYLHPDAAVLDYNWCVPHLPLEQRGAAGTRNPTPAQAGLGLCARYLADRADYENGVAPETRLRKLAVTLQEHSELDSASLLAIFRGELAMERAEQMQNLRRQLQQASARSSSDWESYLQRGMEDVSAALQLTADPRDIPGVPEDLTEEALLAKIQAVIREFGAAIAAWPGIRAAAETITADMLASGDLAP